MEIETSGAIKLFFPNPSLTLVYFEALANALDAGATEVSIEIDVQAFDRPETLRIIVSDNGDGFTDENFDRFKTLLKPRDKFHKGIGRLVFLNYFDCVEIVSTREKWRREFTFKKGFNGNAPLQWLGQVQEAKTKLTFTGFTGVRVKSYDHLKPDVIKPLLIEQFMPTLNACKRDGKKLNISISLKTTESNAQKEFFSGDAMITLDDLPPMTKTTIQDDSLDAFSSIDMHYHVMPVSGKGSLLVAFNIDGRTIPVNLIPASAFPVGYMGIFIFESSMFHSNADSSRQKLILPEGLQEARLYRFLRREVGKILASKIPDITKRNKKVKEEFEEKFPHLLGYFENDTVGLINRDDALEIAQKKFFRIQKQVLQSEYLTDAMYEKSLEISSRTLTEYILYRNKIIARMKEMTADNSEAEIHNLIVPRFMEFSKDNMPSEIYQNNAWLLDDKFMVFRTILSEQRMDVVINAIRLEEECERDAGRPDIAMIFSADPQDVNAVDVVVIEIKKKTDDEKENQYAINQLLDRAVKLAAYCPNIQRIWYYAVIQISDTMGTRLRQQNWSPLFSMGRLYYQELKTERPDGTVVPTPTFVVSFDAIVADAESRNHAFLEILRNGMKEYAIQPAAE